MQLSYFPPFTVIKFHYSPPLWRYLHFGVVVGLGWSKDPDRYASVAQLLVVSPMPERSKVMTNIPSKL